jgi:hypothetical protein
MSPWGHSETLNFNLCLMADRRPIVGEINLVASSATLVIHHGWFACQLGFSSPTTRRRRASPGAQAPSWSCSQ